MHLQIEKEISYTQKLEISGFGIKNVNYLNQQNS